MAMTKNEASKMALTNSENSNQMNGLVNQPEFPVEEYSNEKLAQMQVNSHQFNKILERALEHNSIMATIFFKRFLQNSMSPVKENLIRIENILNAIIQSRLTMSVEKLAMAHYLLGIYYKLVQNNGQKLFLNMQAAANLKMTEAEFRLGIMYKLGHDINPDQNQAMYWLSLAANKGHLQAQNDLGCIYATRGDEKTAAEWFRRAAVLGFIQAQYNLAEHLETRARYLEIGLEKKNLEREFAIWYQRAALQGLARAQYRLAFCYRVGKGVQQDFDAAILWYSRAANQGIREAQFELGGFYDPNNAGNVVVKNIRTAFDWYQKAAAQDHTEAQFAANRLKRQNPNIFNQGLYHPVNGLKRNSGVLESNDALPQTPNANVQQMGASSSRVANSSNNFNVSGAYSGGAASSAAPAAASSASAASNPNPASPALDAFEMYAPFTPSALFAPLTPSAPFTPLGMDFSAPMQALPEQYLSNDEGGAAAAAGGAAAASNQQEVQEQESDSVQQGSGSAKRQKTK